MGTVQSSSADSVYAVYAYGNTSWGTLSSFCFLLSGIFTDLLLVRWSLVFAYAFLIIAILLGFPSIYNWGMAPAPVFLAYGTLIWNVACLLLGCIALWRLLWDDRPIRFRSPDEESVWRCLNRRCGLARSEAKLMFQNATWRTFDKGDVIYDDRKDIFTLNFIVEGLVHLQTRNNAVKFTIGSGKLFDLRLLSLFGIFLGFEYSAIKMATARSKVLVMTWDVADVLDMASGTRGPALANYWRALALYTVSAELVASNGGPTYTAKGQPEGPDWSNGARCADLTEPPTPDELAAQKTTFLGILSWILHSMSMFPPPGLRHHAAPASGALALNRFLLEQHLQEQGSVVPRCLSLSAAADADHQLSSLFGAASSVQHRNPFRRVLSLGGLGGLSSRGGSRRGLQTTSAALATTPRQAHVHIGMTSPGHAAHPGHQPQMFQAQQPSLILEEDPSRGH